MVHCWDEYMWKVHKAVPMDPWADNIQLLDVLIQNTSSPPWLPSWLPRRRRTTTSDHMSRVGSILSLGKDSLPVDLPWKQQVVPNTDRSIKSGGSTVGVQANKLNGGATATLQPSSDPVKSPKVDTNASVHETMAAPPLSDAKATANVDVDVDVDVPLSSSNTFAIKSSTLPDIETSIKSSTSLLASLTGGSSASAQFDVKGSKTVTCNISGVKSKRIDVDALLGLVTPRTTSGSPALWEPDIFLPQLRWSAKRGQTLWVVVEIMYANKIRIEADNQGQAKAVVKATGSGTEVNTTAQAGVEKEGLWTVMASAENPMFPLAFRLQRLDYDTSGSLIFVANKSSSSGNRTLPPLQRHNSVNNSAIAVKHHNFVPSIPRSFSLARS